MNMFLRVSDARYFIFYGPEDACAPEVIDFAEAQDLAALYPEKIVLYGELLKWELPLAFHDHIRS